MDSPPIVSPQEWQAAHAELLVKEKELTHARDAIAAERRRLPRMLIEKEYVFEGPAGPANLLDLFEGRRQLIVYRFFFGPEVGGWPEIGCVGCSMMADQDAHPAHLNARDTTLAYVSRAPQPDIERLKAKMGWEAPWYTDLFRQWPRRRGARQHLQLSRPDAPRSPGGLGGLARWLPAGSGDRRRLVAAPRRI